MAYQTAGREYTCLAATPSDPRPTVLVFDSGVGGLSVYDEIRHLLPNLHYIYAFDNVAFPYGERARLYCRACG
jgi:glutamate racemase